MDSSSDDSFAWTNASSDCDGSDSMSETEAMTTSHHQDGGAESDSGSSYKKKLQKQLFQNKDHINLQHKKSAKKAKKRKLKEEPLEENEGKSKAKYVKSEPESDFEPAKKKKKKSRESQVNGNLQDSLDAMSEESYLNMRVKEEKSKFPTPNQVKHKKEKLSDENDDIAHSKNAEDSDSCNNYNKQEKVDKQMDESTVFLKQEPQDTNSNKFKKKKSKKDKDNIVNFDKMILIEKFSADEADVETSVETNKCKSSRKSRKKCSISENVNSFENLSVNSETLIGTSNSVVRKKLHRSSNGEGCDNLQSIDKSDTNEQFNDESSFQLAENVQRIARISDRIRFEDEENSELETAYEKRSKLLQVDKFGKAKNLKPALYKIQKQALISENDEIWLLRCPQDIDTNSLKGVDLTIDYKCKIKVGGLTYEGSVDVDNNSAALLTSDRSTSVIRLITVNGLVNLRRRVPKPHYVEDKVIVNNQTDFIPLPETKCRHPLFGSDYKRAIKLSETVRERLNGAVNVSIETELPHKKLEKKKKRKLKDHTDGTRHAAVKLEPQLSEVEVHEKKNKKRRKHSPSEEILTKKLKRLKQDHSSAEVWDSEKAIEENLFNY